MEYVVGMKDGIVVGIRPNYIIHCLYPRTTRELVVTETATCPTW